MVRDRPTRDRRELDVELEDDAGLAGRSRSKDMVDGDDVGPSPCEVHGRGADDEEELRTGGVGSGRFPR